jgi:Transposase DNA-binding
MTTTLLQPDQWAQSEFALAKLADQRRTQRWVKIATNLAHSPGGTLPQAFPVWSELKAAYRFFNQPKATFEEIQRPHWQRTRAACQQPGEYLLIEDTRRQCLANPKAVGPTERCWWRLRASAGFWRGAPMGCRVGRRSGAVGSD